jgi:two-component system LytT family response regulator
MKISVAIVDDEPLARERIRTLLASESDVEVIAECACGADALAAFRKRSPALIFLDVQMPEMDGFALLRELSLPLPVVIFATAFDEHAVSAFEVHALDYLLKPFKPARFRSALARARVQLAEKTGDDTTRRLLALLESRPKAPPHLARLAVRDRDRVRFVKTADIDWLEASGNYVVIHAGKENLIMRETLAALEAQLSPAEFFRLSRSALVRLDRVKEVEPTFNDEHVVVLATGARLPLSRGVRELQDRLRFA